MNRFSQDKLGINKQFIKYEYLLVKLYPDGGFHSLADPYLRLSIFKLRQKVNQHCFYVCVLWLKRNYWKFIYNFLSQIHQDESIPKIIFHLLNLSDSHSDSEFIISLANQII